MYKNIMSTTLIVQMMVTFLGFSSQSIHANTELPTCKDSNNICQAGFKTKDTTDQAFVVKPQEVYQKQLKSNTCELYAYKTKGDKQLESVVERFSDGQMVTRFIYAALPASQIYEDSLFDSNEDFDSISDADLRRCELSQVPLPAATWLLISALVGFIAMSNRR
jgi:hypothetical protein